MILYGSTGSIGVNTLRLAKRYKIPVSALACGDNIKLLNEQIAEFKPKFVCIKNPKNKSYVNHKNVFSSQEGLEKILEECEDKLFVNAIVGFDGLRSSLKAKELGKEIALANKESLVIAGEFLKGAKIRPIDSEHCALNFLIKNQKNINKLFITASGGAFWKNKIKDLSKMKAQDALKHPNWNMGAKITIDSATMVNKLFEIIEAYYLFNTKNIDALIEPKSLIHAMCEFKDGTSTAYFSYADMKLAISQALFKNNQYKILKAIDFTKLPSLRFYKISIKKYPIFTLKDEFLSHPQIGVLINRANEIMVKKFLNQECSFLDISKNIFKVLNHFGYPKISNIDEIFEYDRKVKHYLK